MSKETLLTTSAEKETGRIEAFSDGVFAIAITLLVLEVRVPRSHDLEQSLGQALMQLWPSYLAFLIGFFTILVMWVNHHRLFTLIHKTDTSFLFLNGLLLLVITFVPFPTSLLAEYITRPEAKLAAQVYAGMGLVLALAFTALWNYAARSERLLAPGVNHSEVVKINRQYRFGPPLYLLAFVAAFFSVWLSIGICTFLGIFFALGNVPKKLRS
jgi:uncharacterized membrane protein